MTIKFTCRCGRMLKAAKEHAGKHSKCPTCGARVTIPTIALPKVVKQEVIVPEIVEEARQWYMKTEDGGSYGPTSKSELDAWVGDGRVGSTCQVLQEGWDQWKWAEEVYPELAESGDKAEESPFAGIGSLSGEHDVRQRIRKEGDMTDSSKCPLWKIGLGMSIGAVALAVMSLSLYMATMSHVLKGAFVGSVIMIPVGLVVLIVGCFRRK